MPFDVFISYSRKDSEFALKLTADLERRGINVWIDQGDIVVGDAWRKQIVDGIEGCRVFLVVLSPNSVKSENVIKELSLADSSRKKIIPIVYQSVDIPKEMEYQLAGLQYQAFNEGTYEDNLARLAGVISNQPVAKIAPQVAAPAPSVPAKRPASGSNVNYIGIILGVGCGVVIFAIVATVGIFGLRAIQTPIPTTAVQILTRASASTTVAPIVPTTPVSPPTPTITWVLPTQTPTPTITRASPVPQSVTVFSDDFNGSSLDASKWVVDNPMGTVSVRNGVLQLASTARRYPYVYSRNNPFPTGDFRLAYSFRYPSVGVCGVGIAVTSYFVPAGLDQNTVADHQRAGEQNGVGILFWQDSGSGFQLWYRSASERPNLLIGMRDTEMRRAKIEYVASQYKVYLDNQLKYTSPETPFRPSFIWMGHPADLVTNGCDWSTLEIDSIQIESLPR